MNFASSKDGVAKEQMFLTTNAPPRAGRSRKPAEQMAARERDWTRAPLHGEAQGTGERLWPIAVGRQQKIRGTTAAPLIFF